MSDDVKIIKSSLKPNGVLHISIPCPNCGMEMTDLEYQRKERDSHYLWVTYRVCPKCNERIPL